MISSAGSRCNGELGRNACRFNPVKPPRGIVQPAPRPSGGAGKSNPLWPGPKKPWYDPTDPSFLPPAPPTPKPCGNSGDKPRRSVFSLGSKIVKYSETVVMDDFEYVAALPDGGRYFLCAIALTLFNESTELCVYQSRGEWHARYRSGSEYLPIVAPPSYDIDEFLRFVRCEAFHGAAQTYDERALVGILSVGEELIIAWLEFDTDYKGGEAFSVYLAYGPGVPDLAYGLLGEYAERML
jgi:hypothetical protein